MKTNCFLVSYFYTHSETAEYGWGSFVINVNRHVETLEKDHLYEACHDARVEKGMSPKIRFIPMNVSPLMPEE